jgi:hypothetical protein
MGPLPLPHIGQGLVSGMFLFLPGPLRRNGHRLGYRLTGRLGRLGGLRGVRNLKALALDFPCFFQGVAHLSSPFG